MDTFISNKLSTLPIKSTDTGIRARLMQAYTKKVNDELTTLLSLNSTEKSLVEALKCYLQQNHERVKGSALDYTALPLHPTTLLLAEIAEKVSRALCNPVLSPLELLYPGFSFESSNENYPQLTTETLEPLSRDEQQELSRLIRLNTDLSLSELQKLECKIQTLSKAIPINEKELQTTQALLDKLRHNKIVYRNLNERYQQVIEAKKKVAASTHILQGENGLIPKYSTANILRSHVLSNEGQSLIPVFELTKKHGYRVYSTKPVVIDEEERHRLEHYSINTNLYAYTFRQYEALRADKSHFLGHLIILKDKLKFNDAHGGIGQNDKAGEGAYIAISNFKAYYDGLSDHVKNQVPYKVRNEILRLFHLGSTERTEADETCIGLIREKLEPIINSHQIELAKITNSQEEIANTLERLAHQLNEMRTSPENFYAQENDDGDKLPLKTEFLQLFDLTIDLNSKRDFDEVMAMSPDDIQVFAQNEEVKKGMASHFKSKAELLTFLQEHSIEKIKTYLNVTKTQQSSYPAIRTTNEWIELLIQLHPEKMIIFLQQYGFMQILELSSGLSTLLKVFSPEQQKQIVHSIIEMALEIIQNGSHFATVFRILSAHQKKAFFDEMKQKLPNLIKDPFDICWVLRMLNGYECEVLLDLIKENLSSLINDSANIEYIFFSLDESQSQALFNAMKENLPSLIKDRRGFSAVFRTLTEPQCKSLLDSMKEKLSNVLKNLDEINSVFINLHEYQSNALFDAMKKELANLIKDPYDICSVLRMLNGYQCEILLDLIKEKLSSLINDSVNIECIFLGLDESQSNALFNAIKENLPSSIKNSDDFSRIFQHLSKYQFELFLDLMKEKLPSLIKDIDDFPLIFGRLSEYPCGLSLDLINEQLLSLIKDQHDFSAVFQHLNGSGRNVLFDIMKEKLPSLIKDSDDFSAIFQPLNPSQRKFLFDIIIGRLPSLIHSFNDFKKILKSLLDDVDQRQALFSAYLTSTLNTLKPEELVELMHYYLSAQLSFPSVVETRQNQYTFFSSSSTIAVALGKLAQSLIQEKTIDLSDEDIRILDIIYGAEIHNVLVKL